MQQTRKKTSSILLITQQMYTISNNGVQFGESCGFSGGMAPAFELGTNPWHGYSLQAIMLFFGSTLQNPELSRQTPWFLLILAVFFCLRPQSSRSLSRGSFFYRLVTLSADRHLAKTCLICQVRFERIFGRFFGKFFVPQGLVT